MEYFVTFLLLALIVMLYCFVNPSFRQGWRNSKFLDELKEEKDNNKNIKDLIEP